MEDLLATLDYAKLRLTAQVDKKFHSLSKVNKVDALVHILRLIECYLIIRRLRLCERIGANEEIDIEQFAKELRAGTDEIIQYIVRNKGI